MDGVGRSDLVACSNLRIPTRCVRVKRQQFHLGRADHIPDQSYQVLIPSLLRPGQHLADGKYAGAQNILALRDGLDNVFDARTELGMPFNEISEEHRIEVDPRSHRSFLSLRSRNCSRSLRMKASAPPRL